MVTGFRHWSEPRSSRIVTGSGTRSEPGSTKMVTRFRHQVRIGFNQDGYWISTAGQNRFNQDSHRVPGIGSEPGSTRMAAGFRQRSEPRSIKDSHGPHQVRTHKRSTPASALELRASMPGIHIVVTQPMSYRPQYPLKYLGAYPRQAFRTCAKVDANPRAVTLCRILITMSHL